MFIPGLVLPEGTPPRGMKPSASAPYRFDEGVAALTAAAKAHLDVLLLSVLFCTRYPIPWRARSVSGLQGRIPG